MICTRKKNKVEKIIFGPMTKMQAWVGAARLRTLPLSISGILFGSFYAYYQNKWDAVLFTLAMATTLLLQILSNFANDLGDTLNGADNEDRVGPQRSVQSGVISIREMKFAVALFSILFFGHRGTFGYSRN